MRKILFLLLFPAALFAQGGFVPQQTAFKTINGQTFPIGGATITVCGANAIGIPCSPALSNAIFKDAALTQPLSNPFTADSSGNYQFAIAPGQYTVTVTASGYNGNSSQVTVQCTLNSTCTWTGTQSFSGPANLNNGGSMSGNFTGNPGFSGAPTVRSLNGDLWLGSGAGQYANIAACISALPVTGGTCNVPNGYSETYVAIPTPPGGATLYFHGTATINLGTTTFSVPAGFSNFAIKSSVVNLQYAKTTAKVKFVYTGTGTALSFGGVVAGGSAGLVLEDFYVDYTGAGSSSHCIDVLGVQVGQIRRVTCAGPSSGSAIGILWDGQCCSAGNTVTQDMVLETSGVTGAGVTTGLLCRNNCNANQIRNFYPSISSSGIGIDFECVSSIGATGNIGDVDLEILGTGVQYGNCAGVNENRVRAFNQGNTVDALFGASSTFNYFEAIGLATGPKITDNSPHGSGNGWSWMGTRTLLDQQPAGTALTGNSADQAMYTYTMPANTLGPGKCFRAKVVWFHNSGTALVNYKINVGSAAPISNTSTGVDNSRMESAYVTVCNNAGVQNAQNVELYHAFRSSSVANVFINEIINNETTTAIDFTSSQVISATFNVANTDQVTPKFWIVEMVQ